MTLLSIKEVVSKGQKSLLPEMLSFQKLESVCVVSSGCSNPKISIQQLVIHRPHTDQDK